MFLEGPEKSSHFFRVGVGLPLLFGVDLAEVNACVVCLSLFRRFANSHAEELLSFVSLVSLPRGPFRRPPLNGDGVVCTAIFQQLLTGVFLGRREGEWEVDVPTPSPPLSLCGASALGNHTARENFAAVATTKIMEAGGRRGLDVCTRTARCMYFQLKTTIVFTFPFPWNATSLVVRVHRRQLGEGESGTPRKTSLLS